MHSWDPLLPWFSASDKFSPIMGGVPTPATIFPLLWEDHINNHLSLGVSPRTQIHEPHVKLRSPLAIQKVSSPSAWSTLHHVKSRLSEGIEPFTMVNSPLCQVEVTPHNPEGIEPFTLVNSPPGQVGAVASHPIDTL